MLMSCAAATVCQMVCHSELCFFDRVPTWRDQFFGHVVASWGVFLRMFLRFCQLASDEPMCSIVWYSVCAHEEFFLPKMASDRSRIEKITLSEKPGSYFLRERMRSEFWGRNEIHFARSIPRKYELCFLQWIIRKLSQVCYFMWLITQNINTVCNYFVSSYQ